MILLFIEYLQNFVTNKPHKSVDELFTDNWFFKKEIQSIKETIYDEKKLPLDLERKIKNNL